MYCSTEDFSLKLVLQSLI